MELNSILNSNVIRVLQEGEPPKIYPPDLARAVSARYKFVKAPQTVAEFSGQQMDFEYGYFFDDAIITKLSIYNAGIWVEAPTSTENLDRFADDLLKFFSEELQMSAVSGKLLTVHGSTIVVKMKPGFATLFQQVEPIVSTVRAAIEGSGISVSAYEVSGFTVWGEGPDILKPPRFALERRAGEPLDSNLYYSQAPLTTDRHLALLTELESLF